MELLQKRLKECRKEQKLTQAQVAKHINKTRETYTRYENGAITPDIETLALIADLFKTSIDYLVGRY